jgi:hypothetical protein
MIEQESLKKDETELFQTGHFKNQRYVVQRSKTEELSRLIKILELGIERRDSSEKNLKKDGNADDIIRDYSPLSRFNESNKNLSDQNAINNSFTLKTKKILEFSATNPNPDLNKGSRSNKIIEFIIKQSPPSFQSELDNEL